MKPLVTASDCIPCMLRQAAEAADRAGADDRQREAILRSTCRYIAEMSFQQTPPQAAREIHSIIREITGKQDLYAQAKQQYNRLLLHAYPALRERVRRSRTPFSAAARMAIGGNIIDFGLQHGLDERRVFDTLAEVQEQVLAVDALLDLETAVQSARQVLYLADNAGEIVLDKLFIEQFPESVQVTVAVKSAPILNDATMADVQAIGLNGRVRVIENGFDAPGTVLDRCSPGFRQHFAVADVVISKGQGNYETLVGCGRKALFYLLKVKCSVVARQLDVPVGSIVAMREDAGVEH